MKCQSYISLEIWAPTVIHPLTRPFFAAVTETKSDIYAVNSFQTWTNLFTPLMRNSRRLAKPFLLPTCKVKVVTSITNTEESDSDTDSE